MIQHATTFYHRTEGPRIVSSDEEFAALGDGWADTPAAFYEPEPAPLPMLVCGQEKDGRTCGKPSGHRGAHAYREASL